MTLHVRTEVQLEIPSNALTKRDR